MPAPGDGQRDLYGYTWLQTSYSGQEISIMKDFEYLEKKMFHAMRVSFPKVWSQPYPTRFERILEDDLL